MPDGNDDDSHLFHKEYDPVFPKKEVPELSRMGAIFQGVRMSLGESFERGYGIENAISPSLSSLGRVLADVISNLDDFLFRAFRQDDFVTHALKRAVNSALASARVW